MSILRSLAVVLVIAIVVVAVGGHRFVMQHRVAAEEVVQDSFAFATAPRVIVETFNGPVEIVTIPDGWVEARVTKYATGSSEDAAQEGLDEIAVVMDQEGDTLRITARRGEDVWQTGQRSAAVHLQVPADTILELRTSNGAIEVVGLTRDVTAQTSNGHVHVTGSRGRLKLGTSNGGIKVDGGRDALDLRTSNGRIEVKTKEAAVTARTSNGAIHVESDVTEGEHYLHSSNGNVVLVLPSDSQFQVDARTSNGKIVSTFPVKHAGKPQKRRLQGQFGTDPNLTLKLETSNGSIEIRKE